jgi:BirA family transcriptional regulator, biotin operon repressor / biotin---[acetyl-CoA-carboxylase] ligase
LETINNAIGNTIQVLNTVDSSNNYAMHCIHAGMAEHGQVWFALEQTAGKGQMGKVWHATTAQNIMMSVALEIDTLHINEQFKLSAAVAVALHQFFSHYAGANTKIKWPNDIYWADSKAGGVLIENIIGQPIHPNNTTQKWKWAVVGIGININQTNFEAPVQNAISLQHITKQQHQIMELVSHLCQCLQAQWQLLKNGGWPTIYSNYNQHLFKLNQAVRLRVNNVVIPCTIKGVSPTGQLLIHENDEIAYNFGEVKWEIV